VAGFFIDLAVRHPERPGSFLLGIECDGASYHSAKSARDRDRWRQVILENLGWNIHRVWSTDWFRDPRRETDKIVARIRANLSGTSDEQQTGA
jgi:very-short-patch-repair endonuclease